MNLQDFKISVRKYQHSNRIILDAHSQNENIGINCRTIDGFLIAERETILIYSSSNLQPTTNRIKVPVDFKKVGYQNKILQLKMSHNEKYLAVLIGNKTIKNENKIETLFIYE